jgi:undecaprenyl-diphosphatase
MLEQLDQKLFLFINSFHTPFWDVIMHSLSGKLIWAPMYLAILIYLGSIYKRKSLVIILVIILAVTLSDQLSVQLFKNTVQRLRPCHEPALEGMVHLFRGECGGLYGFVSSHASNSFNIAVLSLLLIRQRWYTIGIIIWASVIGYSRIYLGVHYPGDVICGSIVGAVIGWSCYRIYVAADRKVLQYNPWFNAA